MMKKSIQCYDRFLLVTPLPIYHIITLENVAHTERILDGLECIFD